MQGAAAGQNMRVHGRAFSHIASFHPEITALRRDLHAHPELGFEEFYTSKRVHEALKVCGVDEIHTGIGKTGLVALVKGRGPSDGHGKMIGLRADMDALPLTEHNDFAWKSATPGLMHGCGHDGHTGNQGQIPIKNCPAAPVHWVLAYRGSSHKLSGSAGTAMHAGICCFMLSPTGVN